MSTENSEIKPAGSAASSLSSAASDSTKTSSVAKPSGGSNNNEIVTESIKLGNTAIKVGGKVAVATIENNTAQKGLDTAIANQKAAEANAAKAKTDEEGALKRLQAELDSKAAIAQAQRVHEAAESTKQLTAQENALNENARQFNEILKIEQAESTAAIAISDKKLEVIDKFVAQCDKKGEISDNALSAILSTQGTFGTRLRHNAPQNNGYTPTPSAAPQPKGPSM